MINNPALLLDILATFRRIDSQTTPKQSIRLLTTRRLLRKPLRTSLNELETDDRPGEEVRAGKRVHFRDDQETISIKLIRNDLSRSQMASLKENISMARLIPTFREPIVL